MKLATDHKAAVQGLDEWEQRDASSGALSSSPVDPSSEAFAAALLQWMPKVPAASAQSSVVGEEDQRGDGARGGVGQTTLVGQKNATTTATTATTDTATEGHGEAKGKVNDKVNEDLNLAKAASQPLQGSPAGLSSQTRSGVSKEASSLLGMRGAFSVQQQQQERFTNKTPSLGAAWIPAHASATAAFIGAEPLGELQAQGEWGLENFPGSSVEFEAAAQGPLTELRGELSGEEFLQNRQILAQRATASKPLFAQERQKQFAALSSTPTPYLDSNAGGSAAKALAGLPPALPKSVGFGSFAMGQAQDLQQPPSLQAWGQQKSEQAQSEQFEESAHECKASSREAEESTESKELQDEHPLALFSQAAGEEAAVNQNLGVDGVFMGGKAWSGLGQAGLGDKTPELITAQVIAYRSSESGELPLALTAQGLLQVGGALRRAIEQGGGALRLKLNPHSLGELNLQVQMKGRDVGLQIQASTFEAQEVIANSLDALRTQLGKRQLTLGEVEWLTDSEQQKAQFAAKSGIFEQEKAAAEASEAFDSPQNSPRREPGSGDFLNQGSSASFLLAQEQFLGGSRGGSSGSFPEQVGGLAALTLGNRAAAWAGISSLLGAGGVGTRGASAATKAVGSIDLMA